MKDCILGALDRNFNSVAENRQKFGTQTRTTAFLTMITMSVLT